MPSLYVIALEATEPFQLFLFSFVSYSLSRSAVSVSNEFQMNVDFHYLHHETGLSSLILIRMVLPSGRGRTLLVRSLKFFCAAEPGIVAPKHQLCKSHRLVVGRNSR